MNPIKNKRDLETTIDELRNSAFNIWKNIVLQNSN